MQPVSRYMQEKNGFMKVVDWSIDNVSFYDVFVLKSQITSMARENKLIKV